MATSDQSIDGIIDMGPAEFIEDAAYTIEEEEDEWWEMAGTAMVVYVFDPRGVRLYTTLGEYIGMVEDADAFFAAVEGY